MEVAHIEKLLLVILLFAQNAISNEMKKFSMLMPNVHPNRDELYLCTPVKVLPDKSFYIVGFEPNATMNTVHHMILFGCTTPGAKREFWDCGEMATGVNSHLPRAQPCAEGSHVLYAWARDADSLELPDDVGFQIGIGTQVQYLVLQVHYAHKFPDTFVDRSGINLIYTQKPRSKLAGVVLLATGGTIPPHGITHMESNCVINEHKTIYPFAYRTHTHSLGKVVSGYQVKRDKFGYDEWVLLGKRDPMTPQMFYPTFSKAPIKYGDVLAGRCTMESHRDRDTFVGPTNNDEMCNFYLMYYVDGDTPLNMKYCTTAGPPFHYWANTKYHFKNIPDIDASNLNTID
ncbi:PREDICTED: peptidylglycine alpha-hydroxylating monooxygenase [Nicrophorus vespilloides]|uniref:peptidylglycine monooxygenase n=1 Tax=Nicrophorus vespilloides TaxID=110193 RepID=A0ABM1MHY3_NICVS|nr:PREDICTED: peptidylglycine alpha-hydroxylating monooxygenase [Nicrophorus vespilloides]